MADFSPNLAKENVFMRFCMQVQNLIYTVAILLCMQARHKYTSNREKRRERERDVAHVNTC